MPPPGTSWRFSREKFAELVADNRIWFGKSGDNVPRFKRFLTDVQNGFVPTTLWFRDDVGDNQEAKKEVKGIVPDDVFSTPKPERLIRHIITLATNPGDLVLDSFLGSGTTAAVAHKMGRRWIGIEMGEHAKTHCAVRMKKVIDGEQGGVSKAVNWQGGGGFKFYELGEPLLDENGAISEGLEYDTLAAHIWWQETGLGWNDNKHTDLLTPNGVREMGGPRFVAASDWTKPVPPVSRVSGEQIRVLKKSTFLGIHDGVAYALLYNGILHDRSVNGGNVLTPKTMRIIREDIGDAKYDRLIVYGECTKLSSSKLKEANVEFRQTPYDIVTRR